MPETLYPSETPIEPVQAHFEESGGKTRVTERWVETRTSEVPAACSPGRPVTDRLKGDAGVTDRLTVPRLLVKRIMHSEK